MLVAQAAGNAVVEDHPVLGAHDPIADPADLQLGPLVDIEQVEQAWHVRAAQVELPDRGDVDDADVLAYVAGFGPRVTVAVRADPRPRDERRGAVCLVPGLHRRVARRLEGLP